MRSILVVDGESSVCDFLLELFSNNGYEVYIAKGSDEALDILFKNSIDLIVKDVSPELDKDKDDLIEKIKKSAKMKKLTHVPIIYFISRSNLELASLHAIKNQIKFVIEKPCEPDLLLKKIDSVLQSGSANSVS